MRVATVFSLNPDIPAVTDLARIQVEHAVEAGGVGDLMTLDPVGVYRTTMSAPGDTPPVSSVITPEMLPVVA